IAEPPPDARFSVSNTSGPAPLRVDFTDRSIGDITAWLWDFGDGQGSTEPSPTHVYHTPGTYTVRFRVWSAGGVDGTVRRDLILVANPFAPRTGPTQGTSGPLNWVL